MRPDHVFDGGDLDCGSGLVLLIREHMQKVPEGGLLEMRSVEATVIDDLPPWCRMVGHAYLGHLPGQTPQQKRFFVRKGAGEAAKAEQQALEEDKKRAREYEWRLRARATGRLATTLYCRNFQWTLGQPASFEEKDEHPPRSKRCWAPSPPIWSPRSARRVRRPSSKWTTWNSASAAACTTPWSWLGLSDGDPSLAAIELKLFASTFEDEERVRAVWEAVTARSPLAATLRKAVPMEMKIAIV